MGLLSVRHFETSFEERIMIMKRKTLAVLSAAVMAAAVMAGCSNKTSTQETTAAETAAEASTQAEEESTEALKEEPGVDLVIAGGDGAGMIAAVQAVKEGLDPSKVLIVEKSGKLGADITSKENFVNAAATSDQYDNEIDDSFEQFLADIRKAGNDKNTEELAEFVAESGEAAVDWLTSMGIEMEGVTKQDGSSVARSYESAGEKELAESLVEVLEKEIKDLKIQVKLNTTVNEILFDSEGVVSGVKLAGNNGEETVNCIALAASDETLLPLFEEEEAAMTKDADDKATGVLVNTCAEVLKVDGDSIQGLYAVGSLIDPAVHGDKALPGNEMTGMILFGSTAGTESAIYIYDNKR